MKKEVIITIAGYGQELVQGTWTDSEIKKLTAGIDDTDEYELATQLWNLDEIIPDSYDWYDRDNLCHHYGGLADQCMVTIEQDDGKEVEYTNIWSTGAAIEYSEEYNYTGTDNVITCVSSEKGILFGGIIELEETEEFDITKLSISTTGVIVNGYEHELITKISYDNKEIDDEYGSDTSGKGFYAYLQKKKK